ncbi:MAG: hypothetical protein EOO17_05745 [Chloroflexi bacterium]|nr:MAG: hypothetical protein EOO17_05745 [Chloroflexota bacterium]
MSLFDSLKAKADVNGDGKITKADLDALKSPENKQKIDDLKTKADQNKDGKLDMQDLKGANLGQLAKDIKDSFTK